MDMEKVGGNKKCTVFLENIETESELDNPFHTYMNYLTFSIPDQYLDGYFPWGDDYFDGHLSDDLYYLDTIFTIYAIDRASGKHAKIYHSGREARLEDSWLFPRQDYGDATTTNPRPYLLASIHDAWKQGVSENKVLDLYFSLRNHDTVIHDTIGEDILLFLEKGRVYV